MQQGAEAGGKVAGGEVACEGEGGAKGGLLSALMKAQTGGVVEKAGWKGGARRKNPRRRKG